MAKTRELSKSALPKNNEVPAEERFLTMPTDSSKGYIVGKYDEFGRAKVQGKPLSTSGALEYKNQILDSMQTRGRLMPGFVMTDQGPVRAQLVATPTPTKNQKGKLIKPTPKSKVVADEIQYLPESQVIKPTPKPYKSTHKVTFCIDSGKIKCTVDAIIEDELVLALIFENEDSISYLPQQGSPLSLILPDKREVKTFFLGSQLTWYNTDQQILIFVKQLDKEETE